MAEKSDPSNPPTNDTDDQLLDQSVDDNDDLFVSTVESQPFARVRTDSTNETTNDLKPNPIDEFDGQEISLDDEEDNEPSQTTGQKSVNGTEMPSQMTSTLAAGDSKSGLHHDSHSKAILSTSSSTTSSANDALKLSSSTKPETETNSRVLKSTSNEKHIEITVGEPQRVGEGMSAYVTYKVTTKTDLPYFRKTQFAVNRRFSDFLGLHEKLSEKHLHSGRIIPPTPEKNAVGMAKVKISKDENVSSGEFFEKRRAALERYLTRNASHPTLCADPDFREFLELDTDLPKATNTSALSGAGVKRLFSRMGDTVNKITFRMDESDPWFEEKQNQIESLDQQLRKLYTSVDALIHHRKELTQTTGAFAKSVAMLGNCEEHTSLSCALSQLAETEEKIEQLCSKQVDNDFFYLAELLKDYIALIGAVKEAFHQRVKVFQGWQTAQQTLTKKREMKAKLELALKTDKISQANEEVLEWESKVTRGQEEFETISKTLKQEVERFELVRIKDFKNNIIRYMETLLDTQQQLIKYWEAFLPEAKAIA